MNKTGLYPTVKPNRLGFIGYVRFFDNGDVIWSQSCRIVRPTEDQAFMDALEEIAHMEQKIDHIHIMGA